MAFYIRRRFPGRPMGQIEYAHESNRPVAIMFGSDASSDIRIDVTDPNERVHGRHVTLVYTGAGFRIDFERDTRVFIDNSPTPAISLSDPFHNSGSQRQIALRLGMPIEVANGPGGGSSVNPVFHIYRDDPNAQRLNEAKEWRRKSADPIERLKQGEKRGRRTLAAVVALVLLLVPTSFLIYAGWLDLNARQDWMNDIEAKLVPSVGIIGVVHVENGVDGRFDPKGTGWLCCQSASEPLVPYVVTADHVWVQAEEAVEGLRRAGGAARIEVRFPRSAKETDDASTRLVLQADGAAPAKGAGHTLYDKFDSFRTDQQIAGTTPNVYDVRAIPVPPNDPSLKNRVLFVLASSNGAPHSGDPVAAIGYPLENLTFAANFDSPVPKVFGSSIVRRTSPFLGPPTRYVPSLMALPAESAGGISGGPVIVGDGRSFHVVGLITDASLQKVKLKDSSIVQNRTDTQTGEVSSVRFATSNIVFATDSETVREVIYPDPSHQRLRDDQATSAWRLSQSNQFRDPLIASFGALTAEPGCDLKKLPTGLPYELRGALSANVRADRATKAALQQMGGYSSTQRFSANEYLWVAAQYDKALDAPLELDVHVAQEGGAAEPADAAAFMIVPGFTSYIWWGAPKPGQLEISVRGQRGKKVQLYIERCRPMAQQGGVSNGQH